jgi:hypothetical protein
MAAENSGWADGSGDLMMRHMRPPENDRVLDWRDELQRIEHDFPDLPNEARAAVLQLVRLFQDEDGGASEDQAA